MKSFVNRITSRAAPLARSYHGWLALGLLAMMAALGLGSMLGNSAIVDEVAHIPAGYSYLHYQDYRLNPEHPPLIKDLAGLPLQFMNLKFPEEQPAWTTAVNGQWETGWNFLYHIGNNADQILFWARLPILMLAVGFGAGLYVIVRRRWGTAVALVTLFFYALSPNIIAHSTVVATDLGASVFIFLAIVSFARYVTAPTRLNLAWLAGALAAAQLAKFSAVLLYPFLAVAAVVLVCLSRRPSGLGARVKLYVGGMAAASVLSMVGVWAYYGTQVARMPLAVQDTLIRGSLTTERVKYMGDALLSINHLPLMKPLVQYLLGIAMVLDRVNGGNVTYFNGQVTALSFPGYFPEIFVLKTQLAFLILGAAAGIYALRRSRASAGRLAGRLAEHMRGHVLEWLLGMFAGVYFIVSVKGNLNLGIRHILPIYIPLFVLVAIGSVAAIRHISRVRRPVAVVGLAVLLLWYGASTILSYPSYFAYFNEAILGQGNSGKYFSDSSVDWGQDLKRLKTYVASHPEITRIGVDYFGGGDPKYYFCTRRYDAQGKLIATADGYDCSGTPFEEWHAQNGTYPGQYIAVSETFLENDRYYAAVYGRPGYDYLRARQPVAKIGNSIYVYKMY